MFFRSISEIKNRDVEQLLHVSLPEGTFSGTSQNLKNFVPKPNKEWSNGLDDACKGFRILPWGKVWSLDFPGMYTS